MGVGDNTNTGGNTGETAIAGVITSNTCHQDSCYRRQSWYDWILLISVGDNTNTGGNTSKWAKIANCSQDTALRDIADLIEKDILRKDEAGGRSTSYILNEAE